MNWRKQAILSSLEQFGPMALGDIAALYGTHRRNLSPVISSLRAAPRQIYIAGWSMELSNQRRYPRPVYALGDKRDAPKPKPDLRANQRRYEERVRRRGASVFEIGLSRMQRRWRKEKQEKASCTSES